VLAAIGAEVLDLQLALARAGEQFDPRGQVVAKTHRRGLSPILERLVALTATADRVAAAA
jgi:hypothetical protein